MDAVASVGGVGNVAGHSVVQAATQLRFQTEAIVRSGDVSANALKLIQAAVVATPAPGGHTLDVQA